MKKALLLVVLLLGSVSLWAQKLYFIFIQSDSQSSFYVKMGDKVSSSSTSGYLILSRLKDSTYNFQVGPSATDGELQFKVPLNGKDRGFLLKKFPEGWGLFDMQTMQVLMPVDKKAGFSSGVRAREDRFTSLLARAADDTTLFYQPVFAAAPPVKTEAPKPAVSVTEKKSEPLPAATVAVDAVTEVPVKVDTVATADIASAQASEPAAVVPTADSIETSTVSAPPVVDTVAAEKTLRSNAITARTETAPLSAESTAGATEEVYKRSKVIRRAESSNVEGFGLVFWDDIDGVVDTIRILIPNQKVLFAEPETVVAAVEELPKAAPAKATETIASCTGQASEKDFFRIRKNLVAYESEKQMVAEAKSSFRKKCFSAEQIKSLSSLFLTQEGKWLFLEAAYPHVTDKDKFASLQSELFEETYLARFKSLIAK